MRAVKKKTKKKTGKQSATKKAKAAKASARRSASSAKSAKSPKSRAPKAKATKASSTKSTTARKASSRTTAAKGKKAAPKTARAKASKKSSARNNTAGGVIATAYDPIQFPEEGRKTPKTQLTAKQLREFRELLLAKRHQLAGDVQRLTEEALHRDNGGETTHMPIHMADVGSDNWEQDFTIGLIANEQTLVREIDEALERIRTKTYGVCLATHRPISLARLMAKPWAKYCIEYARAREEGRLG